MRWRVVVRPLCVGGDSVRCVAPPVDGCTRIAAVLNDVYVGAIGCRLEAREDGKQDLYVMTLSVLEAYRKLGLGAAPLPRPHPSTA